MRYVTCALLAVVLVAMACSEAGDETPSSCEVCKGELSAEYGRCNYSEEACIDAYEDCFDNCVSYAEVEPCSMNCQPFPSDCYFGGEACRNDVLRRTSLCPCGG